MLQVNNAALPDRASACVPCSFPAAARTFPAPVSVPPAGILPARALPDCTDKEEKQL